MGRIPSPVRGMWPLVWKAPADIHPWKTLRFSRDFCSLPVTHPEQREFFRLEKPGMSGMSRLPPAPPPQICNLNRSSSAAASGRNSGRDSRESGRPRVLAGIWEEPGRFWGDFYKNGEHFAHRGGGKEKKIPDGRNLPAAELWEYSGNILPTPAPNSSKPEESAEFQRRNRRNFGNFWVLTLPDPGFCGSVWKLGSGEGFGSGSLTQIFPCTQTIPCWN